MNDLRMELKICEGCGALWLRAGLGQGCSAGVYCKGCARTFAEFPKVKGPKRPSRTRVRQRMGLAIVGGAR